MNEPGAKGLRIMTSEEIIKILTQHNAWRRGDGSVMTDVYVLGQAIDGAISALAAPQPQDHSEDNLDMVDRVPDAGETMREAFEEGIRLSDRGHILERSEIYGWYKDIEMVTRWETFQNGWQAAIRESRNTDNQTVKQDFTVESAPTETELSETELVGELIFDATLLVDYAQTMSIKNSPNVYESNRILGRRPDDASIRTYFILCAGAHYAITKALPSAYRPYWQYGWTVLQLAQIAKSHKVNVNFSF